MGIGNRLAEIFPATFAAYAAPNGNGVVQPVAQAPAVTSPTPMYPFWQFDEEGRLVREITDGGTRRGLSAYLANVLVYGAINYRMRKVSEAPLIPVEVNDAGNEWIEDHEIAPLLARPNPDQSGQELIEETQLYMDGTGMALWLKSRDRGGRVGELRAFHGDEFQVERLATVTAEQERRGLRPRLYGQFRIGSIRPEPFMADDVVFFRFPNPTDRFRGLAPVKVVADLLGVGDALTGHVRRALENGAQVGGMFEVPAERVLEEPEYQRLDAIIRSRYSGGNSYRPFLGEGGLKFHQMAHSFKDLQLGELWREVETAVCTAFSVRPEIIPMLVGLENSPWSHMETAERLSYREAIIPLWTRYQSSATDQLLRDFDDEESHELRFDRSEIPALQDDLNEKADILVKVGNDMTRDERRAFLGFQPLTPAEKAELEERRPPTDPDDTDRENRPGIGGRARTRPKAQTTLEELETILLDELRSPLEFNLWLAVQSLLRGDSLSVAEVIRASLEFGVVSTVLANRINVQVDAEFAVDGPSAERWRTVTRPYLLEMTRAGVARLPDPIRGVGLTPLELADYADRETAFLITNVSDTTRRAVRRAVSGAAAEGDTVEQLASTLEGLGEFGEARSRLIAQTEMTRILNGSADEAALRFQEETGREVIRTWHTQEDDRVRPEHEAQNGSKRKLGDEFPNGVTHPSEPGCRCFLTWSVSDE